MLNELTTAEKSKSYAKYYYEPLVEPSKVIYEFLEKGPIDPNLATTVHQRNDLLKPGSLPAETGYCKMPDGTGFISIVTKMPGVTSEMLNWWFAWHGLLGLRYKIWDRDDHFDIHVTAEDLEHRLDMSLNTRERNWGTTDIVDEDIGGGATKLSISFLSPEDYGYDMEQFRAPNVLTAICANAGLYEQKIPLVTFSHLAREIPGGIELRSRFWMGWHIIDKIPVKIQDDIPMETIRGLAFHCPKEYTNLASILPSVYIENVDIIDKIEDFKK